MFSSDLISRFLWATLIISAGVALWWIANRWILLRAKKPGLALAGDAPALLYFTTPTCAPCKTFQRPAIQRLKEMVGDSLKIIEIDAIANPELAKQWGVLSVPTTFILDEQGNPRHVNHGPTGVEKLLQQINDVRSSVTRTPNNR